MSADLMRKIAGLLAKAERTDNPHEAEAFSRKAEQLMIKHGIDETMARATGTKPKEEIINISMTFPKLLLKGRMSVAHSVILGLNSARCYKSGEQTLIIVGFKTDVENVQTLINSILLQADHALAVWWKDAPERKLLNGGEAIRARRQFLFSFAHTVKNRLTEMRSTTEDSTPGSAIVLRSKMDEVDAALPSGLRSSRSRLKGGTAGASAAGASAGQSARLGGSSVGGRSGRALGGR
jgi:hypothetical protein